MRDLFIILTIISAASALPLPSAQDDLDLFSFGSGLDSYDIGFDDSSPPYLLAGSDTGNTDQTPPAIQPPTGSTEIPAGFDPDVFDIPWSIPDGSWTGTNRPSRQPDGSMQTPEDKFIQGERGEDYLGDYDRTINPDVGGPTSFELSPDQTATLLTVGTVVVNGVTWLYNAVTGTISTVGNAFNGFIPAGNGL